jgi:glutamate---cysteine ligase / carboxylate-amine ligase
MSDMLEPRTAPVADVSATPAIATGFGVGPSFRVGVEEELLLVSPDGRHLDNRIDALRDRVPATHGRVEPDTFAACVELVSPVLADTGEVVPVMASLRAAAIRAGATLMGSAAHPLERWGGVAHASQARYQRLAADLRWLLDRTPTCALHVHVGMPDAETAIFVHNRMRTLSPMLIAAAANSPFLEGRDSGHASVRHGIWRAFPRTGTSPSFRCYESYSEHVAQLLCAGQLDDFSYLWWDVRINPRLGTVEVRVMDSQSDLQRTAGLVALVHGLVLRAAEDLCDPVAPAVPTEVIDENCFRAARDGMDALLWDGERHRRARELVGDAVLRAQDGLENWGVTANLGPVKQILRDGNGADRQRSAYARAGERGLLAGLLTDTSTPACSR